MTCVQVDPRQRPTVEQLYSNPIFQRNTQDERNSIKNESVLHEFH